MARKSQAPAEVAEVPVSEDVAEMAIGEAVDAVEESGEGQGTSGGVTAENIAVLMESVKSAPEITSLMLGKMFDEFNKMNSSRDKLQQSRETVSTLDDAMKDSEDEFIVEKRNKIDELRAMIKELRKESAEFLGIGNTISDEDRAAIRQEVFTARSKGREIATNYRNLLNEGFAPSHKDFVYLVDFMFPERQERSDSGEKKVVTSDAGQIRDWAKKKGIRVPARGRLPKDVVAQYEKENANSQDENPEE